MRPRSLTIEGFTAFRSEVVIDFSKVDLFVLCGATGAGKSSVLDAMTFALFGYVARLGSNGLDGLISMGMNRASVTLTFALGAETYLVQRRMYRKSTPTSARLDRQTDSGWQNVEDGVRAVNGAVAELLGLDSEAFARAVFLPQGKFADFLHATGAVRRRLLIDLFRLNALDTVRHRASVEAGQLRSRQSSVEMHLETGFDGISEERLGELEAELDALDRAIKAIREQHVLAQARERELTEILNLVSTRQKAEAQLADLEQLGSEIDALRATLARAEAATNMKPALERHCEMRKARDVAAARAQESKADIEGLEDQLEVANKRLCAAEAVLGQVEGWRTRIEQLRRLAEQLSASAEAQRLVEQCERDRDDAVARMGRHQQRSSELAVSLAAAEENIHDLDVRLRGISLDQQQLQRLQQAHQELEQLVRSEEQAHQLEAARQSTIVRLEKAISARDATAAVEDAAKRALNEVIAAHADAVAAEQHLRMEHLAETIRRKLHDGDTCPVCQQHVSHVPPASDAQAERLNAARARVEACARAVETHRVALSDAAEARARAESATEAVQAQVAEVEARVLVLQETIVSERGSLVDVLNGAPEHEDAARWALGTLGELERQARIRTDLERERVAAQRRAAELREALDDHRSAESEARKQVTDWTVRLKEAHAAAERARAQVGENPPEDPEEQISNLRRKITEAETAHRDARDAVSQSGRQVEGARATLQERQQALNVAEVAARDAELALEAALREHGFDSVDDVADALLGAEDRAGIQSRVTRHGEQLAAARKECDDLANTLAGRTTTREEVSAATAQTVELSTRLEHQAARRGQTREQLARVRDLIDRRTELELHRGEIQQRLVRLEGVEHALQQRDDRFPEFVLAHHMQALVDGASVRLQELSDRYTLGYCDSNFVVIDRDNGDEVRPATTLSGGETFLVSLALALELSAQIQQDTGALHLDSLFIDEGFGTLDPETLDTVANALERLQETGRLVGIVTHVEELRNRLPHRMQVVRGADTATVEWIDAAVEAG